MPNFLEFIKREARFFIFSRSLFALVIGLLCWPCLLYLLDLYDSVYPILESAAFNWVISTTVFSIAVFLILLVRSWTKKPSVKNLARQVEQSNPDLLDLLNCAVELEDKSKQRSLTFMENRVLRQTEEKASEIVWTEGTRPPPRFWASLVFGLMLSLLFTAWSVDPVSYTHLTLPTSDLV